MHAEVGGFESASLQVNFGMIPQPEAEASMTLFAREVMPHFKSALTERETAQCLPPPP